MILDVAEHLDPADGAPTRPAPLARRKLDIVAGDRAVIAARADVARLLASWRVPAAVVADAAVCLSALVEAMLGDDDGASVAVEVERHPHAVRFALSSTVSPRPAALRGSASDVLGLLDEVCDRWGADRAAGGMAVWFELADAAADGVTSPGDATRVDTDPDTPMLFADLTRGLDVATDAVGIAESVTSALRTGLHTMFAGVALRDGDTMHYLSLHPLPSATVERWESFPIDRPSPVAAACLTATAYFHDTPDEAEAEFPGLAADMRTAGTSSIAHLPLRTGEAVLGTLAVAWSEPHPPAWHRDLLRLAALATAQALHRVLFTPVDGTTSTVVHHAQVDVYPVRVNLVTRAVTIAGRPGRVALTGREFALLVHLLRTADHVQSRTDLLRAVWEIDFAADTSVVEVTVSRLRRKLRLPQLETVKDAGYVFRSLPSRPVRDV